MAYSIHISFEGEGGEPWHKMAARLRNPRSFMSAVGEHTLFSAQERLNKGGHVQTGALLSRGLHVFEVSDSHVIVGSNFVYAAQLHFGGRIEPVNAKALAIPLLPELQKQQLGPLDIDPNREFLQFRPSPRGKPNVFGVLINPLVEGKRGRKKKALSQYKAGPLFALARYVDQPPHPFLLIDDDDMAEIRRTFNEYVTEGL